MYIEDKAFWFKKRIVRTNERGQMNKAYKTRFLVLTDAMFEYCLDENSESAGCDTRARAYNSIYQSINQ
jgi:hypothetical protein